MKAEAGQRELCFDRPATAPHNRTDTSILAARSVADRLSAVRQEVFDFIETQGVLGATCDQVEVVLGMSHQTASARINDLHAKMEPRLIRDSGLRRPTRTGSPAKVWIVAWLAAKGDR